jgi:hypothetical protein
MSVNNNESSLTTPMDRDLENKWKPQTSAPVLNDNQTLEAMKELNITSFVEKFPKVDRTYSDPAIPLQLFGLLSFVPAKGAKPNEHGIYGFAKLRGNYATEIESNQRAEFIIRNVDSFHKIFHTYVGRPFPLTESSDYSAELSEIDIRKQTAESISTNIREKKMEEQQVIREIKQKEENLLAESKRESSDPYEDYITMRVKNAQLQFTYLEHLRKKDEIKDIILKTRKEIKQMDEEYPEFSKTYYQKYMDARKEAGIKESEEDTQSNFIKFLVEDAVLPGIDDVVDEKETTTYECDGNVCKIVKK